MLFYGYLRATYFVDLSSLLNFSHLFVSAVVAFLLLVHF